MSPSLTETDINAAAEVMRSGMLVQGEEVIKLEKEIAELVQTQYAVAVSSGTATLHLALIVLGIQPGDEVIVPAFSYVATANVVELVGAKPIFVDINTSDFNIDIDKIEAAITSRTKAIIPVHEFGLAADIQKIVSLAKKYNLAIIEDAACALGATENEKSVGGLGNMGSFSFHPRKAITSGEGGILTFNDKQYLEPLSALRNHGIVIEDGNMQFKYAGFNYRMTNFQAALIVSQLTRFYSQLFYKQKLANIYLTNIKNHLIQLPSVSPNKNHTWQSFHVLVDDSLDRDQIIGLLRSKNIGTNYGAQCIPALEYYQKKYSLNVTELYPGALRAYKKGLVLPLYDKLSEVEIEYIINIVNEIR